MEKGFQKAGSLHPFACYHTAVNDIKCDKLDLYGDHIYLVERQRVAFTRHAKTADIRRLVWHICHRVDHPCYTTQELKRLDWGQVMDEADLLKRPYLKSSSDLNDESDDDNQSLQAMLGSQRSGGHIPALKFFPRIPDPNRELGTFYGLFTDPKDNPIFQAKAAAPTRLHYNADKFGCIEISSTAPKATTQGIPRGKRNKKDPEFEKQ